MSEDQTLQVVSVGDGRVELVEGSRRRTAYAVRSGADTWVFLNGIVHVVRAAHAARKRSHTPLDDESALAAPMPATVVSVSVTVGQAVARGDVLVTLEAMKMELAVKAPRDATVRRINCREGELVQPGVPLLELE